MVSEASRVALPAAVAVKPHFIIIGAAKSGTTSLYRYLIRHPRIFMSVPKEPNYFAFDERFQTGKRWYTSLFKDAEQGRLCGEASTNYTNWPLYANTVDRMASMLPDARLIYLMRHPVDRAYAHYLQLIENVRAAKSDYKFERTFEQHMRMDDSIIYCSNYMVQIEQYLKRYSRDQMLFLIYEEFIKEPQQTLIRVARFLGIDPGFDWMARGEVRANANKDKAAWLIRSSVTAPFRAVPGGAFVADHLPKAVRDAIYRALRQLPVRKRIEAEYIPPKMLHETRAQLLEYFRAPNTALERFLDQDLASWGH